MSNKKKRQCWILNACQVCGEHFEHVFWIHEQAQKTEQIRYVLIINLLVNLDWKKSGGFHYTSELGFSEFMTFYITRNARWSWNFRLLSWRNLNNAEFAIRCVSRVTKKSYRQYCAMSTCTYCISFFCFSFFYFHMWVWANSANNSNACAHFAFPTYEWNMVNWYVTSFPTPTSDFWG